jgi:hypothetical protein
MECYHDASLNPRLSHTNDLCKIWILAAANFRSVLEFTLNLLTKALWRLTLAKSRNIVATLLKFALLLVTKHHV